MKYKCILADPPWQFNDILDKTRTLPYNTMTIDALYDLPICNIADDDGSHLYLWCPAALLDNGIICIDKWGFDYKTIIVWEKYTKHGKKHFGMGHYFRGTLEVCLFGTQKNMKTLTNNTRNSFEAIKPDRHHSAKPDEMYEIIEANSPEPRLELFATQKRAGWDSFGYEIDGKDIRSYFK